MKRPSRPRLRPFLEQRRERRRLPERIEAVAGQYEARGERVAAFAQLAVGLFLALFYALVPELPDGARGGPMALGFLAYLGFTAAILVWCHYGRLPKWIVALSIVVDVGFLFGLILYFPVLNGEETALALKAPVFLYVFVLVAVRSLRIDAYWVATTGVVAALGWGAVTAYAVASSSPETLTSSFTDYLSGDRIFLGAELDKVVALLGLTAILTIGLVRARSLLLSAVRDQIAREDIGRFLPAEVERAIIEAPAEILAGDAEERDAAIVMLDIRGFTGFVERAEPREVVDVLIRLHARLVPIIEGHGGIVDKYLGDGLLATFGAARASESAAADAVAALVEMIAVGREWTARRAQDYPGLSLSLNGAVTAGPVVFAALGDGQRLEYTVIGDAVNLAAKLEKHNKREGSLALTTQATLDLATRAGYVPAPQIGALPGRRVDGVALPVDLVVLAR
ncbi:adenylate/guanylate cyclase domain-containing protein [Aurantimonas sp. Leaf443]|uniref:adenylate/guanylate cyclase domain-containing protein n=1 Tax=Aurantimonas sp. Leaf443 TaxID=1736378 RepID=UPI0006FF8FD8|nr:adenylate/guanylate cyclase domain-containing protein [Aurantimonas sp. Leaf443]KQT86124.1 hypothetical protein ASG48_05975 [Aurantimonas sp. Leaf443]